MAAGTTSGAVFAATWRNDRGEVEGTTDGSTMCRAPIKPWRLRAWRDDFEVVLPCGECPGCLEFQRRRLAQRLYNKYGAQHATLFVVRIWATIDLHASISHALHRRRGLDLEPGMWRLGASSFALLARSSRSPRSALERSGLKFRIEPLRLRRGRRAFRVLTAGLTVAREIYGAQRNRFYARGLPKLERDKMEVRKIGKYQTYSRIDGPRAFVDRRLVLVPPEVWKLRRTDRIALRRLLLRQSDPEGVQKVMRLVADAIRGAESAFNVSAAPKALLSRDSVMRQYQQAAERAKARSAVAAAASSITPTSEVGGYVSSEHSQGELLPKLSTTSADGDPKVRAARAAKWETFAILERLRLKITGGG